jgi:hypothetical protein
MQAIGVGRTRQQPHRKDYEGSRGVWSQHAYAEFREATADGRVEPEEWR